MHSDKMKRKVAKVGRLRLSPNEEALLVKEEIERRRKLRLQQVREQERYIASQIREDVKHRRDEQLHHLAEELKAEWQDAQAEKIKALEKLYLSSLRAVGEGHRHAKENEPDLNAIAKQVAVCNQRAEKRHREALKELKQQRESQLKEQSWHIRARKQALHVEKERAATIASLPAPPPDPFENIEAARRIPAVKFYEVSSFSGTHYHLPEPCVDREMETEQPDARLAAQDEAKRLEELHSEDEREKREQLEKAQLRGHHALKMVHLTQDRERLLKELEQMQQDDLCRRRQAVAQMPPQLFEPAYRRVEMREDWQRELEFAFEDMYTGDRKFKGDLILQLEPEPLPAPSIGTQDDELDLSMDPGSICHTKPSEEEETETIAKLSEPADSSHQPQSNLVLRKLLNRIRSQKGQKTLNSELASVSETIESGSLLSEARQSDTGSITVQQQRPEHPAPETMKPPDIVDTTVIAGNSILLHPQEQAARVRMAAERQRQVESLEEQKQHQLALLQQLEQQRISLQENFQNAQLRMQESSRKEMEEQSQTTLQTQINVEGALVNNVELQQMKEVVGGPEMESCKEDDHLTIIRNYQQRLLQQNKQHKESVEEARKRLQDYQIMLKKRYPLLSSSSVDPAFSAPSQCTNMKPFAGPLSEASGTVPQRLSPVKNTQFGKVPLIENTEPFSSHLVNSSILKKEVYPSKPVQHRTTQEHFQNTEQKFPSSEPVSMFGVTDTPLYSNTKHSPKTRSHLESVLLPPQSVSVVPLSQADLQQTRTNVPQDYFVSSGACSSDHRPDVEFWKNLDVPKPAVAQSSAKELVDNLTEARKSLLVPSEPIANLQYQKTQRSRDVLIEQSNTQPSEPSTLFCGQLFGKGTAYDQWAHQSVAIPLPNLSNAVEYQKTLLASSEAIKVQQDHLKQLQWQLDQQRDMLLSKQRTQEQSLLQKQNDLKEQMQSHQEALLDFLRDKKPAQPKGQSETHEAQQFNLMSSFVNSLENSCQEDFDLQDTSRRFLGREHRWRSSKPPVTKMKLGPIVEQHELSAIQELESPRSGRPSFTAGRKEISGGESSFLALVCDPSYSSSDASRHSTDLSRVSTSSRDQNSCDSTSGSSKLSWRERLTLETALSRNSGQSKDSELIQHVPSYVADAEEGTIYPDPNDRAGEEVFSLAWPASSYSLPSRSVEALGDYLSSTTIYTGSFSANEKVDSSLGDTAKSKDSELIQHVPSYVADAEEGTIYPDPNDRADEEVFSLAWPASSYSLPSRSVEALGDYLSSTTISTGSFSANEKVDSSPGDTESSSYSAGQCSSSYTRGSISSFMSLPVSLSLHPPLRQENPSENQTTSEDHKSHIQQIIDKYTKDLNGSFERNVGLQAPTVAFNFSHLKNGSFNSPSFHLLEPKPDFDFSSMSVQQTDRTPHVQDLEDLSKSSVLSTKSQEPRIFHLSPSSSIQLNRSSLVSSDTSHSPTSPVGVSSSENIILEADSSDSFYQLLPELTLGEQNLSATESVPLSIRTPGCSNQSVENINYATLSEHFSSPIGERADELLSTEELPNSQPLVETLRSESASSFQKNISFYELDVTEHTANDSLLSEPPMKDCKGKTQEDSSCFETLSGNTNQAGSAQKEGAILVLGATDTLEEMHRHLAAAITEDRSSSRSQQDLEVQLHSRSPVEVITERADWISYPELPPITSSLGKSAVLNGISAFSNICGSTLLQSSIPIWGMESGHGIMEEPELTLISLNDSCVTVPDLEHVNQEDIRSSTNDNLPCLTDSELKSCSWHHGFASLLPEADSSMFTSSEPTSQAVKSPGVDPASSQQYAVMQLEFTSSPGNLQEAFLKKKKDFIQQSSKRLEEIKMKERVHNKTVPTAMPKKQTTPLPLQMEPSSYSESLSADVQLKKVSEVKVCTPEDRKTAEVQMHQRTLRLYNQLDEVKTRKTEKMRQKSYAKNRGKAKEFHKKTLEKLRAKMMP